MTGSALYDSERRLFILQFLVEMDGVANDSVIITCAERKGFQHTPREEFRGDLDLLGALRLTKDEWLGTVRLVTITERGREVAHGRIEVAGVKHELWRRQ